MGATDPGNADEGTIRRAFAANVAQNIVHGSDTLETARTEIACFFDELEIIYYQRGRYVRVSTYGHPHPANGGLILYGRG